MLLPYCLFRNHTFYKFMGTGRQQPRILIANISYPIYNFTDEQYGRSHHAFCNYATPPLFIIGTWVSVYFLLKEKQL